MKILLVHNYYQQPGGEDVVFEQECGLLERKGHDVLTYVRSNEEIEQFSTVQRIGLLKTIVSAGDSKTDVRRLLQREKPDVAHIHNTFMMVSPSIYQACAEERIPVVQTLHNYRLLCPAVTLYRNGKICEECIDDGLLRAIQHGCYRGSRPTTAAVVAMLQTHRYRNTWASEVDAYIALTEFARNKFIDNGLPEAKVHVKPNFVDPDPGERDQAGNYVLFVGRLSQEKGVSILLDAWKLLDIPVPLKIVGDGPRRAELQKRAVEHKLTSVELLGQLHRERTRDLIRNARFLVLPSLWYEGFPMVLAESFACGVPVIGSRLGAMEELIDDGQIGLHFGPGDPADLARKIAWAWSNPAEMAVMGHRARRKYEHNYGTESNYRLLMNIYCQVIDNNAC
jgi:glycosyltransferase involved in cell wall biosynthesis